MTAFRYEAARSDGGMVRGLLDAASEPAAAAVLSARGLYPVVVEASQPSGPFFRRTSTRQLATVFESLAAFVDAGVPFDKALQATARVAAGPLRDTLGRVGQRVREGGSLGGALAAERSFSPVTVGLVRAGERGVGLGAALGQAAAQLERDAETEARVRSALTYPTLLAVVGSGAIALIVLFVIPRFAALLSDLGQALPATTRILLALSDMATEQAVPAWDTIFKTEPNQNLRTAFAFNTLGNVLSDTSPAGRVRTYTRDSVQRVSNAYDPAGHRVEMVYDPLNRLLQSIQHVEGVDSGFSAPLVTRQHYDIDVLDSIIGPRNVIRRYVYDAANRRTAEIDDFGHVETTFYDRGGLVDSIRPRFYSAATIKPIRFTYDEAGRVTKKAWPSREELSVMDTTQWVVTAAADSILYTYDILGRILTATQAIPTVSRTYYPTGTTKTEVQGAVTLTYAYDRAGRRTWYRNGITGNLMFSDSIWYRYDAITGDLNWVGVRWRQAYAPTPALKDSVLFRWDALGRRDTVAYTNGARVKFAYDADGMLRLVCGDHTGGPTNYDVFDFTYYQQSVDLDGMIRATTNFNPSILGCGQNNTLLNSYAQTYDSRHQLRTQSVNGTTKSYVYDGSGNILQTAGPTADDNRSYNMAAGHNRLDGWRYVTSPTTGLNLYYGEDGGRVEELNVYNGQEDPNGLARRRYWYDGLGRTTGTSEYVCPPIGGNCLWEDNFSLCRYDPFGRLFDACQNGAPFLGYDGENAVHTSNDQTVYAWSFVHGPGLDDPVIGFRPTNDPAQGKYWYWVTDGQGRQFAVGDASGNDMSADNEYTSNGGKYAGGSRNANSFGIDRNGSAQMFKLSVFRNRIYDQQTGRWTQEDPIGVAGGLNLYSYVGNNPVMFTDPFGLCPPEITGKPCVAPFGSFYGYELAGRNTASGTSGSLFGATRSSGTQDHYGIDLKGPVGQAIVAAGDGTITIAGDRGEDGGLGVQIQTTGPGGTGQVNYFHMGGIAGGLKPGATVSAGQVIGYVGTTGNTAGTDPHTHYEVKANGRYVDPSKATPALGNFQGNACKENPTRCQ